MRCHEVKVRLSAYLDRELDSVLERLLRDHLDGCVSCREDLASFQALDAKVQALTHVRMDAEFAEGLTVKVCKDFFGADRSLLGRTGLFGRLTSTVEVLFDLLEAAGSPRTRTLDEFADFPPLSMGYVYCRLLGLCRGD
ncbi:MAG TPA: zf-HC2 domain-containing protein [Syntrophobacteria bacterium]|nr:zf-HC2 domain-containing protein [Syntrophobacteria bacterium]